MTAVLVASDHFHLNHLNTMYNGSPSSPSTPSSIDWKSKYYEVNDLLAETRAELDDFQQSSRELEEELESELERTERAQEELKMKVLKVENERDDWKNKYLALQQTYNNTTNSLQRELDAIRQTVELYKVQLRELEMGNDDLERNERQASSSLRDVEQRYAKALEEKILLEHELQDKATLEEQNQRLRDELRDNNEEVALLKEQISRLRMDPPKSVASSIMSRRESTASSIMPMTSSDSESLLRASSGPESSLSDFLPSTPLAQRAPSLHSLLSLEFFPDSTNLAPTHTTTITPPAELSTPTQNAAANRALSPASSTGSATRLPRRNITPQPGGTYTPRIPVPVRRVPRSKGVQMVTEMRAKVRTLEQKIHSNMPRLRVPSSMVGRENKVAPPRFNSPAKATPDSPWVMVPETTDIEPLAPPVPAADFTSPRPLLRSRSALGRPLKVSSHRSNGRNQSPLPPTTSVKPVSSPPSTTFFSRGTQSASSSRAPSRIATLVSNPSRASAPSPHRVTDTDENDEDEDGTRYTGPRPTTPSFIPHAFSTLKRNASNKLSRSERSPVRRSSGGANTTNAGMTPAAKKKRVVTNPATPPPPLPPGGKYTVKGSLSGNMPTFAPNKNQMKPPSSPNKNRQERPSSLGDNVVPHARIIHAPRSFHNDEIKGRERSGTMG
ncbi:NADH:ubiquinone oxidoreductase [Tulasnella sp. 418]|nr:NADH:ubiquinone oxidoreductase [Tulasnella sp. 418]